MSEDEDEIKCPKCGSARIASDDDYFTGEYYYYCRDCGWESDYQGK